MGAPRRSPPLSTSQSAALARFETARERLEEGLIRPELGARAPERSPGRWAARMEEMRAFLAACGDPQTAFPSVHVTGTSGKGSVCAFVAEALRAAGYRVGLHVSPYLQSPTEKIWVDGELLPAGAFADLVDWVWPVALPRKTLDNPASIHGMASVAIAFEAFRRARVDVAVVEAGCGGRFDLTSFVDTAAAVITSVGLDHVRTLGPSVADIAWHKAGILRAGRPGVTGARGTPLEVVRAEAATLGVDLEVVATGDGPFWEANERLAVASLAALDPAFRVSSAHVAVARERARMPARRELAPEPGRTVVLDGAHNPDKMAALARTLPEQCVVVLGCLQAHSHEEMVAALRPVAGTVVTTEPRVHAKPATPAATLAEACRSAGLEARVEREPAVALEAALDLAGRDRTLVVTGSLFLAGEVRTRWYPTEQVVLQRTCWPTPEGMARAVC